MNEWVCTCIAKCVMRKSVYVSKYIAKYVSQRKCVRTYICIEVYVTSKRKREKENVTCVFRLQNMRVKGRMCTCIEVRVICVVREKENMNIPRVLKVYITRYASVWERTCALKYILIRCEKRREKNILRTYWSVKKCEQEREREFTRARLCARERETRRVSISRKHWTNIDVSSLHFLSRDEKRVVLFIYQLLSSISEWKRGRARNCVNPCPFFSFPSLLFFFLFSPRFTTVCSQPYVA